jgi:hypothetical protein
MPQPEIKGLDEWKVVSKRLRAVGDKGLQREFTKQITGTLKPLRNTKLPSSALETLPTRGGLSRDVARTKYRIIKNSKGLRLTAKGIYDLFKMDRGIVRHPIFQRKGEEHRRVLWQAQRVTPGWFTRPSLAAAPEIRKDVEDAMHHVIQQIEGKEAASNAESLL